MCVKDRVLNTGVTGDVRCGRLITDLESGEILFVESQGQDEVATVVVRAQRTDDRDSAVPLPLRTFYTPTDADVVAVAEASLDFDIIGLRPMDGLPIPTLPIAIRWNSQESNASTWSRDIEQRFGFDRFRINTETGGVLDGSDGIPEIVLRTAASSNHATTNAFVLTLTSGLTQEGLQRQVHDGWSVDDLQSLGGKLLFDQGPLTLAGLRDVDSNLLTSALGEVIGQGRVVFLYDSVSGDEEASVASLSISGLVAGRVMSVSAPSGSECEIVFQPTVMATRSAVTANSGSNSGGQPNKYVANLRLTN